MPPPYNATRNGPQLPSSADFLVKTSLVYREEFLKSALNAVYGGWIACSMHNIRCKATCYIKKLKVLGGIRPMVHIEDQIENKIQIDHISRDL